MPQIAVCRVVVHRILFFYAVFLFTMSYAHGAEIEAITKPSGDVILSFNRVGKIAEVLVKEGQVIRKGQLLARQDDAVEQAQLAQLKAEADNTVRIKAAKAQLDQKRVDLKRIQGAAAKGASTELEVDNAVLEVTIAELSLQLAEFEHRQKRRKYEEVGLQLERMKLTSPIAGKAEQLFAKKGESVDSLQQVIRVVQINPLWIEVPVPLVEAAKLKVGATGTVKFSQSDDKIAEGKVVHVASVADAASDTLIVRMEVPNPSGRPAGERVTVSFHAATTKDNGGAEKDKTETAAKNKE